MTSPVSNLITADYPGGVQSFVPSEIALAPTVSNLSGRTFGLVPNTGEDMTAKLQAALTSARLAGVPVALEPGKYIYTGRIYNAGGGLICYDGEAWFDAQDVNYNSHVIDFQSLDSSYLDGIEVRGLKFTCSTRPNTGLTNGSPEEAHFIRVTRARNVKIWGNKFDHNWGGAVLFRYVEDSCMVGNESTDTWKDVYHITATSKNILRLNNIARGCGDDAFAVVGYTGGSSPGIPVGVQDIGNRVIGVRKARAFAYVGAKDVENIGCYVDGRLPANIPQQTDGTGVYNTFCAIYIASEAGGSATHGCENIRIKGFEAEYITPGKDAIGPTLGYQQIHIAAGNGASGPIKNIKIEGSLRNGGTRGIFINGGGNTQDIEADLIVENNTDPGGYTGTAGTATQWAAEFQNTRNVTLKLRANTIGKGAVYVDAACTGNLDIDTSVGALCQVTAGQSAIVIASGSALDSADLKINFETTPPASGTGSISRIIDCAGNPGIVRSVRVTGVDHGLGAGNKLNGWNARPLTLSASPCVILNDTEKARVVSTVQGTVSNISKTGIIGRAAGITIVTGAAGTVTVAGDLSDLYTNTKVVTFFDGKAVSIATGICSGSTYAAGTNLTTINFAASTVPASFAAGMQLGILGTMKTLAGRTNGIIELPPETVTQITYTVAPTTSIMDVTF